MKSFVAMVLIASAAVCSAAPDKVAYELQERCGKRASEVDRASGSAIQSDRNGTTITNYVAHYNATLNKCFMLVSSSSVLKEAGKADSVVASRSLVDVNSNKEYGSYFKREQDAKPFVCEVQKKRCGSREEWEAMAEPFMAD